MKSKFEEDEYKDILAIFKLDGVLAHLKNVYIGDAVEVEGDLDDDSGGEEGSKKKRSPDSKKKKETAEDFYPGGFVPDSVKEQLIADKLKPLIREMLNKGK